MKTLRKKSIKILSEFGKFGVGKSLILGMFDIEVPEKLIKNNSQRGQKNNSIL